MRYAWTLVFALSAALAAACAADRPAVKAAPKKVAHENRCAEYGHCYADPADPSYKFTPNEELTEADLAGMPGMYQNAISGPGYVWNTTYRPANGLIQSCPVLWLTETYAITVAHCANSNGVTHTDFDYLNRADLDNKTMKLRDQNGLHERIGNVDLRVILHSGADPETCCSYQDNNDVAMYRVKNNKWSIPKPGGDARARIYVSGINYPYCLGNSHGYHGGALFVPGTSGVERVDTDVKYCPIAIDDLASTTWGYVWNSAGGGLLPYGSKLDYENGDSGGAVYITTTTTRKPAYYGLMQGGSLGDSNNETAIRLLPMNSWIKAQDSNLGGPAISSWTETRSLGDDSITVRYYTDSSET